MSQDVEVKIKDVNGEEYSVKINQDAKVMDLLIKIKSEKIMASAEKLKLYDSLSILLRGKCITMEQNLYSENLPTLKDLGVDKESEMKIVFSSNKDNKLANFIKFDEIPDSFKSEDKDEITLKIKVNNKESYDIKMNKGSKISDLIAKVKSDKKIKELANGNDFFKITHFKNDKTNLQLCHTGFQDIKLKNLFKETNAILDIKFGNVDEKNYAKFDQSPSNIPIENILINDADSSNIENINDNDTITLSIWDFGDGKEVTKLSVKKTTTMRDIKKQLQQKYNLSDERINELYLSYTSYNMFYDLDLTVEQVCNGEGSSKDIEKREVRAFTNGFDFNLKISEKEIEIDNKSESDNKSDRNKNGIKVNWKLIILIILGLLFLLGAGLAWSLGASWFLIGGLAVIGLICLDFGFMWSKLKSCIRCTGIGAPQKQKDTNLLSLEKEKEPGLNDRNTSNEKNIQNRISHTFGD